MKVNSELTLTCDEAEGSVFSWSKDGHQLTTNKKYRVTDQLTIFRTGESSRRREQVFS